MAESQACPECGAQVGDGQSCFDRLGQLISLEYDYPDLYALHFYTVAGYNLQHPAQFTDEALTGLRDIFIQAVDAGWSNPEVLAAARRAGMGHGKVLRPEAERRPVPRAWPMTIADVAIQEQPEGAAERVKTWTAAIRQSLIP